MGRLSLCFVVLFIGLSVSSSLLEVNALAIADTGRNDLGEVLELATYNQAPPMLSITDAECELLDQARKSKQEDALKMMIEQYLVDTIRQMNLKSRPRYGRSLPPAINKAAYHKRAESEN